MLSWGNHSSTVRISKEIKNWQRKENRGRAGHTLLIWLFPGQLSNRCQNASQQTFFFFFCFSQIGKFMHNETIPRKKCQSATWESQSTCLHDLPQIAVIGSGWSRSRFGEFLGWSSNSHCFISDVALPYYCLPKGVCDICRNSAAGNWGMENS